MGLLPLSAWRRLRAAANWLPTARCARSSPSVCSSPSRTAPHFYLTVDCEIDQLLASRRQLNALAGDGVKISVNDLVIRAAAQALIQVPEANASWEGDHTRRFAHADISMAVAIEGGLITPVIWAAEQKGLAELSQISRDLAERAARAVWHPRNLPGAVSPFPILACLACVNLPP